MKGTTDSYYGINETFEINEVDNKNSIRQINSTTDNRFETVPYEAQQKQQHNGFFFNVNNMEQKSQPKNSLSMILPETQQNQQLVERENNMFIENSTSENIFYLPNPLNMVQENQSLVPNTLSQLYNNPTESLTTTQSSMIPDDNIIPSVHIMPHQNHNILSQEIQNNSDSNSSNNNIHIHHHHHHHHITQHENSILQMQDQNAFIQPDIMMPEDQQNKLPHTSTSMAPRNDIHNGTTGVIGQSSSPPISAPLLPPLQPVLNMSQTTMALDPINKETAQEHEQGSLNSFSSDSGTPSSKDSIYTLPEKKKVYKNELLPAPASPKKFKSNKIRRRHSLSIMNHVDYNELKNYIYDMEDITSDLKTSYKKFVEYSDIDFYFSLKVGPGKHQVKEFNILPINVIKLNYKSKSSDYIVVKLVCDESMKMEENEIFLTAVSAYHTQEDSNYVYLPNLKISQQMLRGRTKGYKFKLKYILVIDGKEMEKKESKEFYLWSNINQKGFPREERMSYVDNKVKSSRKRRKK